MVLETPTISPIEVRIAELIKEEENDQITVADFVLRGLQLGAQRIDQIRAQSGETADVAAVLEEVLNSEEAKSQFARGMSGGKSLVFSREIGGEEWSLCQKIAQTITDKIGPNLAHGPFIQEIVGIGRSTIKQHWRALDNNLDLLPEKMRALVYLDLLSGVACQTMRAPVEKLLDLQTRPGIMPGRERDFWESRIFGQKDKEGIKFCEGYITKVAPFITKKARKLFGRDAQRAINLWRAVTNIKVTDPPVLGSFFSDRERFFRALACKDFKGAEAQVKKWINNPSYCHRFDPRSYRLLTPLLEDNTN